MQTNVETRIDVSCHQDTNGCTVTHIMVVYDNPKMFDMAVECGAAINIENKQKLTPLTTAAFLARMDMFFHIASIERVISSSPSSSSSYSSASCCLSSL